MLVLKLKVWKKVAMILVKPECIHKLLIVLRKLLQSVLLGMFFTQWEQLRCIQEDGRSCVCVCVCVCVRACVSDVGKTLVQMAYQLVDYCNNQRQFCVQLFTFD